MRNPSSGIDHSDGNGDALAGGLDLVLAQVRSALANGAEDSFHPSVTFMNDGAVDISVLTGVASSSAEMLKMFEAFGYKLGRRERVPDFVFVAVESLKKDGGEQIMISGCSKESSLVVGYLDVVRSQQGGMQTGAWSGAITAPDGEALRLPAYRVMCGAISKSRVPWWKFWIK